MQFVFSVVFFGRPIHFNARKIEMLRQAQETHLFILFGKFVKGFKSKYGIYSDFGRHMHSAVPTHLYTMQNTEELNLYTDNFPVDR